MKKLRSRKQLWKITEVPASTSFLSNSPDSKLSTTATAAAIVCSHQDGVCDSLDDFRRKLQHHPIVIEAYFDPNNPRRLLENYDVVPSPRRRTRSRAASSKLEKECRQGVRVDSERIDSDDDDLQGNPQSWVEIPRTSGDILLTHHIVFRDLERLVKLMQEGEADGRGTRIDHGSQRSWIPWKSDTKQTLRRIKGNGIPKLVVTDRVWREKTYRQCFTGTEMVDWMVKYLRHHKDWGSHDRKAAQLLGQGLVDCGFVKKVQGRNRFLDRHAFFKFQKPRHILLNSFRKSPEEEEDATDNEYLTSRVNSICSSGSESGISGLSSFPSSASLTQSAQNSYHGSHQHLPSIPSNAGNSMLGFSSYASFGAMEGPEALSDPLGPCDKCLKCIGCLAMDGGGALSIPATTAQHTTVRETTNLNVPKDHLPLSSKSGFVSPFNLRENPPADNPAADAINLSVRLVMAASELFADIDRSPPQTVRTKLTAQYQAFLRQTHHLHHVQLHRVEAKERQVFFVNVYNALYMHALIHRGLPSGLIARTEMCRSSLYCIGGLQYSLLDIKYGILRHAMPLRGQKTQERMCPYPPSLETGDPRAAFCTPAESRICFALCNGTKSSPNLRLYTSADSLDDSLTLSAQLYIKNHVRLAFEPLAKPAPPPVPQGLGHHFRRASVDTRTGGSANSLGAGSGPHEDSARRNSTSGNSRSHSVSHTQGAGPGHSQSLMHALGSTNSVVGLGGPDGELWVPPALPAALLPLPVGTGAQPVARVSVVQGSSAGSVGGGSGYPRMSSANSESGGSTRVNSTTKRGPEDERERDGMGMEEASLSRMSMMAPPPPAAPITVSRPNPATKDQPSSIHVVVPMLFLYHRSDFGTTEANILQAIANLHWDTVTASVLMDFVSARWFRTTTAPYDWTYDPSKFLLQRQVVDNGTLLRSLQDPT